LSNRIIKAGSTRLLPPDKRLREESPVNEGDAPASGSDEPAAGWDASGSYQAEYDELLEAAQEEVTRLLSDARRQARDIVENADAEADKARQEAYEEGCRSGEDDGYNAALEHAEQAFRAIFDEGQSEVDRVLEEAHAANGRQLEQMLPKLLRLSLDVAEKILGYELENNDGAFLSLVKTALDVMQQESRITLRISAERHTSVFRSKAEARIKTERTAVEADVEADPALELNGCVIETGNGAVDASVSSQLEQIAQNMGLE
jgi:flagellar assembly protein FliH